MPRQSRSAPRVAAPSYSGWKAEAVKALQRINPRAAKATGPLVLRHASKRSSGTWGPDDYDVIWKPTSVGCSPRFTAAMLS